MPSIEVKSLKKSYGDLQAVNGISFEVNEGEVFSLLGPNGAGKTTTIEVLEGLRERDSGEVKVLGLDPWSKGYELHKRIGVIPQGFRFFEYATAREAITYYAALFDVKVDADSILKQVILDDAANIYFRELSGGQKQKVGLALSLVNDPELVFLDEPTTGLDPAARRAVWEVIRKLKKEGRSVLLTTHYLQEAEQLADRVAIMHHGAIMTSGTPEEIIDEFGSGEELLLRADGGLAEYLKRNTDLEVSYDSGSVIVKVKEKKDVVTAVSAIDKSGLDWADLRTQRESLEDIFVRLVGERGQEEGVAPTVR
ncbi:MAG TPA: ABC transporter ATP-binding protein [Nitrososphaerales archaeon]|nr:ABC transporter ATP-binding protein [Nitrososphaerales archaeon]